MLKTSIPLIDMRGKSLIDLARSYPDKAHELVTASRRTYGWASYAASALALPLLDKQSHKWLKKNRNPYLYEIESFAEILGTPGIYTLNITYEWGCTGGVYRTEDGVAMLRVLDWPFPALGKHLMVLLQKGKAGEFYNLTWPAVSGVYTAMAPGRFSAAINQAPMRMHKLGFIGDWIRNRFIVRKEKGIPPAHLLRQVFEQAENYEAAKKMLTETPLAMPVIFTLAGTQPGEGCVIERLERSAEVLDLAAGQRVTAANHFTSAIAAIGKGWRPRAEDSAGRYQQSCALHGHDVQNDHFEWLHAPIINRYTRLCAIAAAGSNRLVVQGYEGMTQVTELFTLREEPHAQQETA